MNGRVDTIGSDLRVCIECHVNILTRSQLSDTIVLGKRSESHPAESQRNPVIRAETPSLSFVEKHHEKHGWQIDD